MKTDSSSEHFDPVQFGAKPCKTCNSLSIKLSVRSIDKFSRFVVITCDECHREATSDVYRYTDKAVGEAIKRWNSNWPEISHYLEADTEGVRYICKQ